MKLSYLSQAWSAGTWLGLLAAFAGFYLAFIIWKHFPAKRPSVWAVIPARCSARGWNPMPELFFLRGGAGGGIGRLLRD